METNEKLLDVKNLYTYFYTEEGVVKAVDGVSFSINKDEILGLVGETGCGKSVTALSILKLVRSPGKIVGGQILFQGQDLLQKNKKEILKYRGNTITMIFQDPMNSLNPVFKVGKQLSEVYLLHQKDFLKEQLILRKQQNNALKQELDSLTKELNTVDPNTEISKLLQKKIDAIRPKIIKKLKIKTIAYEESAKLLDLVGIADATAILDRYPHELSGGMRQRVMISMGLACNSQLLIADEPTTALDVTIQAQILDLILELKKKLHNSVLLITHSLGVIYEICDKVAVMYSGNIVEFGTVDNIMEDPKHPYTQGLLAAIPRINRATRNTKLQTIKGMVPNLIYPPSGCRFHPRCQYAMNICKEFRPELIPKEDGRSIACFLYHPDIDDPSKAELFEKLSEERMGN